MTKLAIIGGTGLAELESVREIHREAPDTPYGETSGPLVTGTLSDREVIFLARHGNPHAIAPHKINYRANIWALRDRGAEAIIAVNAVGGIAPYMVPCNIVIPDQIIDYTWSRSHTFFEDNPDSVTHVDFTHPYSDALRQLILTAGQNIRINLTESGTYAATQGPRLETAAEITRLEQDGCNIVGMTGMPEAALARELEINYASICLVVNKAAGKADQLITMESIRENLHAGMAQIRKLLHETVRLFQGISD